MPMYTFRFTNKPRIKFHMREQHVKTDKTAVCNVCGKILKNRRSLATHLPVHFEELKNRFKCSICGKGYSKKDKLKVCKSINEIVCHYTGHQSFPTCCRNMNQFIQAFFRCNVHYATNDSDLVHHCLCIGKKSIPSKFDG